MQTSHEPCVIYSRQDLNFPSHMNYGKFTLDKLCRERNKIALIDGATDEHITFGEFAQQIVNLASSLFEMGIKQDEIVAICSENRKEFLITMIATFCIGATVTFINSEYSITDLKHIVQLSKPKYMFLSSLVYEKFYETLKDMNIINRYIVYPISGIYKNDKLISYDDLIMKSVEIDTYKPVDINETIHTALILYSSGTTGLPKGVKITHRNLITSGLQPSYCYDDHIVLTLIPWSSAAGFIITIARLLNNQTIVYLWKYQEELYLKCIEKYKVGLLLTVPPMVIRLNKSHIIENYDVTSVKVMYCVAAALGSCTITDLKKKFTNLKHVLRAYGMTEATGAITQETVNANKLGSIGKIILGNIIKIVDIEKRNKLGPNQIGELCVKGEVLFKGYIGRELKDDLDDEGFYCTGDVAYYDDEGYFFIVDRLKELIKYKTSQVSPSELEALLLQHETVQDAAVVGKPDSSAGELPTAFVVKKQEVDVTEKILTDFVSSQVSSWKQLRGGVIFINEIPKNNTGKILRDELRQLLI